MINEIEKRFLEISNLQIDLSKSIIRKADYPKQQVTTRKDKSKEFGEVFTPLFIVDTMIALKFNDVKPTSQTCDLCAGYGQFTIRLMRRLFNTYNIDVLEWLKKYHTLTELQLESCAKLVYIFGPDINLFCGDSMKIGAAKDTDFGILFYDEKNKNWYNNDLVTELLHHKVVKTQLKLIIFIFENYNNNEKLMKLKEKLSKI